MIHLVLGGVKSGKSAWAESEVCSYRSEKIYYGATMRVQDEEMAEKVREHETRRSAVWE
ncbi:MAG: bifunctional adenosylcobinamide kinase/adenosylcobinamide-phosphate guanylyltransferase, partial [Bacilli bacterium]